jgi:hypothetical protein
MDSRGSYTVAGKLLADSNGFPGVGFHAHWFRRCFECMCVASEWTGPARLQEAEPDLIARSCSV